jgi:hypothetical protein
VLVSVIKWISALPKKNSDLVKKNTSIPQKSSYQVASLTFTLFIWWFPYAVPKKWNFLTASSKLLCMTQCHILRATQNWMLIKWNQLYERWRHRNLVNEKKTYFDNLFLFYYRPNLMRSISGWNDYKISFLCLFVCLGFSCVRKSQAISTKLGM